MLRLLDIEKYFGDRTIFQDVSLNLGRGVKIGIVGPNGSGKTTLFKLITGELEPDNGNVSRAGTVVTYLPQHIDEDTAISVGDFLLPGVFQAILHMEDCSRKLELEPLSESRQQLYVDALDQVIELDGFNVQSKTQRMLAELKLKDVDWLRSLHSLSGGERSRIALAKALIHECDLLLLDEPTNNLDLDSLQWLENELTKLDCGVLIVSHDREFLDNTTSKIFEIDSSKASINEYGGNYSWYKARKEQEYERQLRVYNEHQIRMKKLKADVEATKQQSLATEYTTVNDYLRGRSKKVAAKAKARETRLNKLINDEESNEKPREQEHMRLELHGRELYDRVLFTAESISCSIEGKRILSDVNLSLTGSSRVLITGNNGAGKTTLLRTLVGEIEPISGFLRKTRDITIGYLPQFVEFSDEQSSLLDFLVGSAHLAQRASGLCANKSRRIIQPSAARTFLHRFGFGGNQVFQRLDSLSQGERKKVMLAMFMATDVEILILDEPTNHLDLDAMERLESALNSYGGAIMAVTHDRRFAANLKVDAVWHLDRGHLTTSGGRLNA